MKSFILLLYTFFVSSITMAQTQSANWNAYLAKLSAFETQYNKHYPSKEYAQAEGILKTIMFEMDKVKLNATEQKELQANIRSIKANVYYNLACVQSLQSKKKLAIENFKKAIQFGYNEYQHIAKDIDLDSIREEKEFKSLLAELKQYDKLEILQRAGKYQPAQIDSLPVFHYQSANQQNLTEVKTYFKLDSIAGNVDEISKLINVMLYVTNNIKYDGSNWALCEFDAIDFYNYYKTTGKGINCRHKAMMLNEMYLSLGFKSRYITCMPKDDKDPDCHVINCVYSETLGKWLWMDASHGIYVTDENNSMLSIEEVRARLINNQTMKLNKEAKVVKDWYLDYYMAKNLYWIQCTNHSRFNNESRYRPQDNDLEFISLVPSGFDETQNRYLKGNVATNDPVLFWLKPHNGN